MTTPRFEVAFDVDPGVDPGALDWTDLTSRVRDEPGVGLQLSVRGGGSGSLRLDNRDHELDPENPGSGYTLKPMRHARFTVVIDELTIPVWRGYVLDWPPQWRLNDDTIDVRLVDATAWLGLQEVSLSAPAEVSSARVSRLLDAAGWPAGLRDISTGLVSVGSFDYEEANALRAIEDADDAEDGWLSVDPQGRVVVRSRHHRHFSTPDLVLLTTEDVAGASPARSSIINTGRVELADGSRYEYVDEASVVDYGPRVLSVRDLNVSGPEAEAAAQWAVVRYAAPSSSLEQVEVDITDDVTLAVLLGLRVGDLVEVSRPSPVRTVVGHVTRIRHQPQIGLWRMSLDLAPWFGGRDWLVLDDAGRGLLDDDNVAGP